MLDTVSELKCLPLTLSTFSVQSRQVRAQPQRQPGLNLPHQMDKKIHAKSTCVLVIRAPHPVTGLGAKFPR